MGFISSFLWFLWIVFDTSLPKVRVHWSWSSQLFWYIFCRVFLKDGLRNDHYNDFLNIKTLILMFLSSECSLSLINRHTEMISENNSTYYSPRTDTGFIKGRHLSNNIHRLLNSSYIINKHSNGHIFIGHKKNIWWS